MDSSLAPASPHGPRIGQAIASIADLASRIGSPEFDSVRELYEIDRVSSSRLSMNSAGWAIASNVMGLPRDAVENQVISIVRDRFTGHEAIVNSLRAFAAHEQMGLTVAEGECVGWVSLAPVKERDFTALSRHVAEGARFMYRIWRDLAGEGTRNFSLAAILSPSYVTQQDGAGRFARWPNVVWRFVDRGDPEVMHGDIGTMELFGSSVVASDPFVVAGLLGR